MTILEALMGYGPEQKVKIGAKDGTGHWYAGTVADVIGRLYVLNERCAKYALDLQKSAAAALERKIRVEPTPAFFVRAQLKRADELGEYLDLSREAYQTALEKYFAEVRKSKSYLDRCTERLAAYVDLKDREVVRREMCIPCESGDPGTLQIILEGFEDGAFWATDEAAQLTEIKFLRLGENGKEEEE